MAVKIPQDVTREDRLVGPLTLRQFLYVLIGGGMVFTAYQAYANYYLFFYEFVLIAMFIAILAIALAFGKINGRPFGIFLTSLASFLLAPKQLIWHKDSRATLPAIKITDPDIKDSKLEAQERKGGKNIKSEFEKLASILDTGGTIKSDNHSAVTTSINNLNFVTPASQFKDLNVEDVLSDTD